MDNTSLLIIAVSVLCTLAAPDPKVAVLVVLASVVALYARNSKFDTQTISSRFKGTDQILKQIEDDRFVSSSGKQDLRAATEKCFDAYIRAMTQDDIMLRNQHVTQCQFYQESVLNTVSRLDVSTGTNANKYEEILKGLTVVFDEMNDVLTRSNRAQRQHPTSQDQSSAFAEYF
jgi:hypothetical protein